MNKLRKIIFFWVLINFISCEKMPFDYRNKYIGKYDFRVYTETYEYDSSIDSSRIIEKVQYYNGLIKYGDSENRIIVNFLNEIELDLEVDRNGKLIGQYTGFNINLGLIKEDSLYIRRQLGMAGHLSERVIGIKNK